MAIERWQWQLAGAILLTSGITLAAEQKTAVVKGNSGNLDDYIITITGPADGNKHWCSQPVHVYPAIAFPKNGGTARQIEVGMPDGFEAPADTYHTDNSGGTPCPDGSVMRSVTEGTPTPTGTDTPDPEPSESPTPSESPDPPDEEPTPPPF